MTILNDAITSPVCSSEHTKFCLLMTVIGVTRSCNWGA